MVLASGIIWALIAYVYTTNGFNHDAEAVVRHNLLEYAGLMLFLLVAMTYINAMQERLAFDALRMQKGLRIQATVLDYRCTGIFYIAYSR